ncbi:MAG: FprA family A-type flavoprotein, partial [Lachnospiraceae bacterium]|nr:FprA family A-type flavoprotein [Lachnospiraceae bacterium]
QNRTVGIVENGSWGPTAAKVMREILSTLKDVTILEESVTIRSSLKESNMPQMQALVDVIVNAGK